VEIVHIDCDFITNNNLKIFQIIKANIPDLYKLTMVYKKGHEEYIAENLSLD